MIDEKKKYIRPDAEIIVLSNEDIVSTSLENAGVCGEINTDGNPEYFPLQEGINYEKDG